MKSKKEKIESQLRASCDLPFYIKLTECNDPLSAHLPDQDNIPHSIDYQTTKYFYSNFYKNIIAYEIRS